MESIEQSIELLMNPKNRLAEVEAIWTEQTENGMNKQG